MLQAFLNSERQLRNGWWIVIFFAVLAALLVPILIVARAYEFAVSINLQATIIIAASCLCQWLRRKPLTELFGEFNNNRLRELGLGGLVGAVLMVIPALLLSVFGWIDWQWNPEVLATASTTMLFFFAVAVAEELLFRGFVFQRLIAGLGQWPAQLIFAGFFVLTHLNNPGMTGKVKILASANIFLASLLFGLAYIRTRSLAMPMGLHFMANWVQGGLLGFGVSGSNQAGLLKPIITRGPEWLTGGPFGLEASVLGLVSVMVMLILFYTRPPLTEGTP